MRSRTAETALDEPPSIRAASATPRPDTTRQSGGFFARGAVATRRPADHCPAPVRHPRAHSRLTRRRRTKALGLSATMSTWPLLPHRLAVGIGVCVALFFLTSSCASDAVPSKGEPHFTGERAGALEPGTVSTDAVAAMAQRTAPLPETGFAAARPAAEETTVEPVPGLDSSPPPSTSAPPIEPAVPEAPAEDPAATSTLASQDVEGPLSSADSDSSVPLIEEPQPEEPGPEQPQPEEPGPEQPQPEEPQPEDPQPEQPQPEESTTRGTRAATTRGAWARATTTRGTTTRGAWARATWARGTTTRGAWARATWARAATTRGAWARATWARAATTRGAWARATTTRGATTRGAWARGTTTRGGAV